MSEERWAQVDDYLASVLLPPDPALDAALRASAAAGLPAIQVSPLQGRLLQLLAVIRGARRILEIGTLGGYSAIWLARALPDDGRLVTLEVEPRHAEIAQANLAGAGLAHLVDIRVGRAVDTLPLVEAEGGGPFDLFFIDADKAGLADYVRWAIRLSRPGSVIVVDNVVRSGRVLDAASGDVDIQGARRLHELMAAEPRLEATAIQTVGSKGWDGLSLAVVTQP